MKNRVHRFNVFKAIHNTDICQNGMNLRDTATRNLPHSFQCCHVFFLVQTLANSTKKVFFLSKNATHGRVAHLFVSRRFAAAAAAAAAGPTPSAAPRHTSPRCPPQRPPAPTQTAVDLNFISLKNVLLTIRIITRACGGVPYL